MSNRSPYIDNVVLTKKHSGRRTHKVQAFVIHHMAAKWTGKRCAEYFRDTPSRQASANYCIGYDGDVALNVEEGNRAWTSSSAWADNRAITYELGNSKTGHPWEVSDKTLNKLIIMLAEQHKRYGLKKASYTGDTSGTLWRHDWFASTNCPGPYLGGKLPYIANEVNKILSGKESAPKPSKPSTSKPASNNAKLVKNEDAYFLATTNIKVRNAPSTKATHTGTLKKGDSIHYYKVYEGNGYRWLQYVGNSGNKLYLPYRESGSGKEQWGTFHSSRPKGTTTAPATKKIAEDGWFGPDTATLAQQVYGMKHVDGVISGQPNNASTRNIPAAHFGTSGSNLIREMAKEFGVPAKYRDGKITNPSMLIGAMQKYYGTPVDKKVSGPSMVIKEWQKALNKGKRK